MCSIHLSIFAPSHLSNQIHPSTGQIHISSFSPKTKTSTFFWPFQIKKSQLFLHSPSSALSPAPQGISPLHTYTALSVYLENHWPQVRMYSMALQVQYSYLLLIVFKRDSFIQSAVRWKLLTCCLHPAVSHDPTTVAGALMPTHILGATGMNVSCNPPSCRPTLCCKLMSSNQNTSGHFTVSQSHFHVASSSALS